MTGSLVFSINLTCLTILTNRNYQMSIKKSQAIRYAYGQFSARGGGLNHLPKKFLQVAQIFTKQPKRNEGHTMQQHRPYWHMKVPRYSFQGQNLPSLSINYVAINKHLEKLPPQLYQKKMKICHDQGCNDIRVVIATK